MQVKWLLMELSGQRKRNDLKKQEAMAEARQRQRKSNNRLRCLWFLGLLLLLLLLLTQAILCGAGDF